MATPVVSLPVPEVVGTWTTKKLILIEHLNKGQWRYLIQPQEIRSKVREESFVALVYSLDVYICVNMYVCLMWTASRVALVVKNPPANAGDMGLIPGSGRSPGGGNDNLLQYSCLQNLMARGAWLTIVHGVARVRHNWATKQQIPSTSFTMIFQYDTLRNRVYPVEKRVYLNFPQ